MSIKAAKSKGGGGRPFQEASRRSGGTALPGGFAQKRRSGPSRRLRTEAEEQPFQEASRGSGGAEESLHPTQYAIRNTHHAPRFTSTLPIFLLSAGSLLLEIALTRLFSTIFFPPYVFAILSLAILGISLGAAAAALRPAWRRPQSLPLYLALAGYTTLVLPVIVIWPAPGQLGRVIFVGMPYFFIGLALATFFSQAAQDSPRLYQADLLGAGLGVLGAVPLLNRLGSLNGVFVAAGLFGLATLMAARSRLTVQKTQGQTRVWTPPALALCGLAGLVLLTNLNPARRWLDPNLAELAAGKPLAGSLANGGQIIATTWDAFARTDLIDPGGGRPYELYLDGAAGSVMPPAGDLSLLRTDIGFFPFATARPEQVMIIGPGGGLDVWFALNGRAKTITAVEINPASVELVNRFAAYHGNLYRQPGVRVVIDEGRSVLRREGLAYDLIYLSQVVTLSAERSGYTLTENTVYTVEAFADYLGHLRPGGQIALKLYDELTLTRAVVTAVTALRQTRGLTDAEAMAHLAVFLDPDADPPIPLLIVQEQPFEQESGLAYAGVAAQVDFVPLFVPGVAGSSKLAAILAGEATIAELITASSSDVSPTTDDRPFFYQFERGWPAGLQPLLLGLGSLVLVGSVGLVVIQRRVASPLARLAPVYFAALGVGFITVEIALIQQTRLFLGHPTLAVTTVLAVLLIGGGLGSGWAGRRFKPSQLIGPPAIIVLMGLLWLAGWPWLSQTFLAEPVSVRLLLVTLALLPLALVMGMPLPLGLRLIGQGEAGDRQVALAWAVNGLMTVAGSAGAVALAMVAGFNTVLLTGLGAYGLAAVWAYVTRPRG